MPRKKATATKAVRKTTGKKTAVKKKVTRKATKAVKAVSYTQVVDKAYQEAKAAVKKQLIALEKENKQLKSQDNKLAKAQKANQKVIAALLKKASTKASAKSQLNKAQKAQKANDTAMANHAKAMAAVAAKIQNVKQQLAQIISEEQNLIAFRKAKPAAAPKAKNEKKDKKEKKTKASKTTKPAKAKKVKEAVAAASDFAEDENQLALVMEEDFLGDEDAINEDDQL